MSLYNIIIFAGGESSRQGENGEWFDVVWYKFSVPGLAYKDRVELAKNNLNKVKQAIKEKIVEHLENNFQPIEYEEEI